jgi:hypothetical protein
VRVVGGMASAGAQPGSNALLLNDWCAHDGGVGLAFRARCASTSWCRRAAAGRPAARGHARRRQRVIELDGQPALERAEQVLRALLASERERLRTALRRAPGAPRRERPRRLPDPQPARRRSRPRRARGRRPRAERERIRLHVRDAATAARGPGAAAVAAEFDSRAERACCSRATAAAAALRRPDGDISILQLALGARAGGGDVLRGEIGPVGEKNFLHGTPHASRSCARGADSRRVDRRGTGCRSRVTRAISPVRRFTSRPPHAITPSVASHRRRVARAGFDVPPLPSTSVKEERSVAATRTNVGSSHPRRRW